MAISVCLAKRGDRETCVRLLTAQLVEHSLPADLAGIRNGVELAFTLHSSGWLLLAGLGVHPDGAADQLMVIVQAATKQASLTIPQED